MIATYVGAGAPPWLFCAAMITLAALVAWRDAGRTVSRNHHPSNQPEEKVT